MLGPAKYWQCLLQCGREMDCERVGEDYKRENWSVIIISTYNVNLVTCTTQS